MSQISVTMPVYNAERYVGEAIESILAQTYRDFEFIIVDDGSTDGSAKIIRTYAEKDQRIRLISRPNTGIVGALNDGLAIAVGEYIARMDADDRCEPNRFELQVRRLESEPELVAVGSCGVAIDPDGQRLGPAPVPLTHEEIEEQHLKGYTSIFHPAVMIRADVLKRLGGYRQSSYPAEDFDLWLRLGEVGRLANLPEPLFIWRRNDSGIVASNAERVRATLERVLAEAWQRRHRSGTPNVGPQPVLTRAELYRQWGWMALKSGSVGAARKYAAKGVLKDPWNMNSWRLAYCALRGC